MEKPQVFLSYAYDDIETVRRLYRDLTSRGVNVWFDKVALKPGQLWRREVWREIAKSQYFLVCLSQAALEKTKEGTGFVDEEIQFAYEVAASQPNDKFSIIPVRLDDYGRGDNRFRMFQQYDLFEDWDEIVSRLVEKFLDQKPETSQRQYVASDATFSISPRPEDSDNWSFDLLIDPGDATEHDLAELYEALSELHRAYGGVGLVFRNDESHVFSPDLKTA